MRVLMAAVEGQWIMRMVVVPLMLMPDKVGRKKFLQAGCALVRSEVMERYAQLRHSMQQAVGWRGRHQQQ